VFDVGGSHIAAGVFNFTSASLDAPKRLPVPANVSADEFLAACRSLAAKLLPPSTAPLGIALAVPNPFDHDHGISYMQHKYQRLYGVDLRRGLAKSLGTDPGRIHFLNDAAAFLIGELEQGSAVGAFRSVGITLGTGVGSAFAVGREIVTSGPGVPPGGEIWNLPYRDGIVEDVISAAAIHREYASRTGIPTEVREIADRVQEQGQPEARLALERFGQELGQVLRYTCSTFAPERVVLGGGISRSASLFLSAAESELTDLKVQLCISSLRDRAALIGAGISWLRKYALEKTFL